MSKASESVLRLRNRRIKEGKCARCEVFVQGVAHCPKHTRILSQQNRRRYANRVEAKLCVGCGRRINQYTRCSVCRHRHAINIKNFRDIQRQATLK